MLSSNQSFLKDMNKRSQQKCLAPELYECSQNSIVTSISNFIKTVDKMNSTILVPSKLIDLECDHEMTDLYSLHLFLNQIKNELILGRLEESEPSHPFISSKKYNPSLLPSSSPLSSSSKEIKSCFESDDGFSSLNSFSRSSTDDESSDTDSEISKCDEKACDLDNQSNECRLNLFRLHVQQLNSNLNRFTDFANHVLESYRSQFVVK